MRRVVGPAIGVKAAGGIRDLDSALALIQAGATRIGTSSGIQIVESYKAVSYTHLDVYKRQFQRNSITFFLLLSSLHQNCTQKYD